MDITSYVKFFALRTLIIVLAVCLGYIFLVFVAKPVLQKYNVLNTNKALQINYQNYENSVLAHVPKTGNWFWFNGVEVFIYGEPSGRICQNGDVPVYVFNVVSKNIEGWRCVEPIENVQKFYNDKNVKEQVLFVNSSKNYDTYDLLNEFITRQIITINPTSPAR